MRRPSLLALTVPEGLLALGALAAALWPGATQTVTDALPYYRYAVLAIAVTLAWRFDRGRVLLALVVLVLADRAVEQLRGGPTINLVVIAAVSLLAWLSANTEHGVWARRTGMWLALIGAVGLSLLVAVRRTVTWPLWLEQSPLPSGWSPMSTVTALVSLAAAAFLIVRFMRNPNSLDRGFFWTLTALVAAVHFSPGSPQAGLLFGTAGLILAVATVEDAYGLAYRDELTGLGSRRALERAMKRLGRRYSVAMVDVDRFKRLNDRHGHDVGDQVLRLVATRLQRTSGGGRIYRYGGEEFAILFPGRSAADVLPHLEAARATMQAAAFRVRSPNRPKRRPTSPRSCSDDTHELDVTVSIGLADSDGDHANPGQVIKRADQALNRAKKKGRNRVAKSSS